MNGIYLVFLAAGTTTYDRDQGGLISLSFNANVLVEIYYPSHSKSNINHSQIHIHAPDIHARNLGQNGLSQIYSKLSMDT